MRKRSRIFISYPAILLIAFIMTCAFKQDNKESIRNKLLEADSVIIISHKITAGVSIVDDSTGKEITLPKLIINNNPNEKIILEKQIIKSSSLYELVDILDRPFLDRKISVGKCFMPHHALFITKNGKTSYIEICFECRRFNTSKDLKFISAFDERKWLELKQFFINQGLKYELEDAVN